MSDYGGLLQVTGIGSINEITFANLAKNGCFKGVKPSFCLFRDNDVIYRH